MARGVASARGARAAVLLAAAVCCAAAPDKGSLCAPLDRLTGARAAALGAPWPSLDYAAADALVAPHDAQRLITLTASEAVDELCSRRVSAAAYATALLKRARAVECLNVWAALDPARVLREAVEADAREAPLRPLCGLPVGLKVRASVMDIAACLRADANALFIMLLQDMLDAVGYPTTAGTPALEGHHPSLDAALVTKLRAAGGIVLGKLRMHELGGGDTTVHPVYGATLNPHNVTHSVGGSSGGNGAALAALATSLTICADSGGSCRNPAALNGVVGLRPSSGCFVGGNGAVSMGQQRDTAGVMARSVADVTLLYSVLSSCPAPQLLPAPTLAGVRVGVPSYFWDDIGDEVAPVLRAALDAMERAGAVLVPVDAALMMQQFFDEVPDALFYTHEMPRDLAMYLASHNYSTSLSEFVAAIGTPSTRAWVSSFVYRPDGSFPTAAQYYEALTTGVPRLRAAWQALFDDARVAVLALPTTPLPSRPIADVEPMVDLNGRRLPYYDVMGRAFMADCTAGIPGISLPAGVTAAHGPYPAGLPVGLMLHAPRHQDDLLLAVAKLVEAVLPPPPVAPLQPACAGCTARVGWSRVEYPAHLLPNASTQGAMAYAEDAYALDFVGDCAIKKQQLTFPMQSPYAVGDPVDWSTRAGESAPISAGVPACHVEAAAPAGRKDEL
jgi:mandelamide amidase